MRSSHLRSVLSALTVMAAAFTGGAVAASDSTASLESTGSSLIPSNSVSHMATGRGILWIGTSRGLSRTPDGGKTWDDFSSVAQFASPGIYSVDVKGDTVWASTGYTKDVSGSSVQTGSGYTLSTDNGATWKSLPQTMDGTGDSVVVYGSNRVHFLPIVVPEQNVTFSTAIGDTMVWIASWSSGLRWTSDLGATWHRVVLPKSSKNSVAPTDSLGSYTIDPRDDNNFLAFSVALQGPDTVWAGTAGGVNRSTDGGSSWRRIGTDNQTSTVASDWIIAIGIQRLPGITRVWTTNWPAEGNNQQYAVSYTDDGGNTWKSFLIGTKAYGFAFRDTVAYVASTSGVYRTNDGGSTWLCSGSIVDATSGGRITTSTFYAVAVEGDTVYAGSGDGLAFTIDGGSQEFGTSWTVKRAYVQSGSRSSVYAYPNPFSPSIQQTRIHYTTGSSSAQVTIELFDFGMNRVRTLIKDATRNGETDEVWDGTRDDGAIALNGVYFYRVTIAGSDPAWGKIILLK